MSTRDERIRRKAEKEAQAEEEEAYWGACEVLCRVFPDGADKGMEEWQTFYKPKEWLGWPRALGAFIYQRLQKEAIRHSEALAASRSNREAFAMALYRWRFQSMPWMQWENEPRKDRWLDEAGKILDAMSEGTVVSPEEKATLEAAWRARFP